MYCLADVRPALQLLNKMLESDPVDTKQYAEWRKELDDVRAKFPMQYPDRDDVIAPQHAVEVRLGTSCCLDGVHGVLPSDQGGLGDLAPQR